MSKTCSVESCDREAWCRGWCRLHYQRWHRQQPRSARAARPCEIEGCDKQVTARGMCPMHYTRWSKHGDPAVTLRPRVESAPRECAQCGREFDRPPNVSNEAWENGHGCCSRRCAQALKARSFNPMDDPEVRARHGARVSAAYWTDERIAAREATAARRRREAAARRRAAAQRRLDRAARGTTGNGRRWTAGYCIACGDPFVALPGRNTTQACSQRCRTRHDRRATRAKYSSYRRRARYWGVRYEPVDRRDIFERDGHRCQHCGTATTGTWPDPDAPTVDHIIPLCRGGPHEPANLQLLCAACNSRKDARTRRTPAAA